VPRFRPILPEAGILILDLGVKSESFVSGHGFIRAEKQRKNELALAAALSESKRWAF
jgi:hypothetical protein